MSHNEFIDFLSNKNLNESVNIGGLKKKQLQCWA